MKNYVKILIIMLLTISLMSCNANAKTNESENVTPIQETETQTEISTTDSESVVAPSVSLDLLQCGEAYKASNLSYNVIGVKIENNVLRLNLEVYNHSDENIEFTPMDTLTVYDEKNEECSWNMMIGRLNGPITPENKIMGEVGFDLEDRESSKYVLHIGKSFEYEPAIEITNDDVGMVFSEVFESSGIKSEYSIGIPVKSDIFDILIQGASLKESDKDGKDVLLVDLSITNNDSEFRTLGFEISGLYTAEGEELATAVLDWTFPNYGLESKETQTGIMSYYCESGKTDFYMVVKPDINNFDRSETIVFSAEVTEESSDNTGDGMTLLSSLSSKRPETMRVESELIAFNTTTIMTTYYDGEKSRTEIDLPNMAKSILIHLPNEEAMYQYVYGESTGVKILNADSASAGEMGLMMDTSMLSEIKNESSENVIAKPDDLDGEEVIYLEATQYDEEMGEVLVKMWYSDKYATPLKYEIHVGETLMMELKVNSISDNVNFQGELFTPPSDIIFEDIDMEVLMENW